MTRKVDVTLENVRILNMYVTRIDEILLFRVPPAVIVAGEVCPGILCTCPPVIQAEAALFHARVVFDLIHQG